MKGLRIFVAVLLLAGTFTLCHAGGSKKTLYVNDRKVDCAGKFQCLQIKDKAGAMWHELSDTITGFNYEEGYNYKILVKVTPEKEAYNGIYRDQYTLLKVVSKTKSNYNPADKLNGKRWVLKSLYDTRTTLTMQDDKAYIQVDTKTNHIQGRGVCNTFNGTLKVKGNTLGISALMSTKVYCKGNELEKVFTDFLTKANTYTISENTLTLNCADGSNLIFENVSP